MLNEKTLKNAEKFECVSCDFKCSKQSDYTRHLMTRKHLNAKNAKNITPNAKKKCPIDFNCSCGKRFKHQSSYSRHKKTCTYVFEPEPEPEPEPEVKEKALVTQEKTTEDKLLEYIEKQGKVMEKLTEKLEDVNGQTKVINNYNTTNNFNLNMFLNDTCKNAMNITDFMESIKLTLADMDNLGKVGYVDAVSKVIVDGLNQLDVSERPIHCTDAKRNSLYLKNNDEWNKEAADMPNIKKVIKNVTNKNQSKIYDWMDHNPAHKSLGTAKHREYMSIVGEAMGPTTDEEEITKFKSIINRVSSATVIDKQAPPQTKPDLKDTKIQVTEIK
jgi:hypothetical protein